MIFRLWWKQIKCDLWHFILVLWARPKRTAIWYWPIMRVIGWSINDSLYVTESEDQFRFGGLVMWEYSLFLSMDFHRFTIWAYQTMIYLSHSWRQHISWWDTVTHFEIELSRFGDPIFLTNYYYWIAYREGNGLFVDCTTKKFRFFGPGKPSKWL